MTRRFLWMVFILSAAVVRCHAEGRTQGRSMVISRYGIVAVTMPGVGDGWTRLLHGCGRKKLPELLAPVIRYAEEGLPVTEIFSSYWLASEKKLRRDRYAS